MYVIDGNKYPDFRETDFSYQIKNGIDVNPRTDDLNNAYCLVKGYSSSGMSIYKFALENFDNITMQKVNLDQFPIEIGNYRHPFEVDAAGNCMTYVRLDDLGEKYILYKADGGLYEFPKSDGVFDYFVGYNGKMYCCSCSDKDWQNKQYKVFPLEIGVEVSYDLAQAVSKDTQTTYNVWYGARIYTLENGFIHALIATDDTNNMLVYNSKDNTIKEVGFLPGEMEDVVSDASTETVLFADVPVKVQMKITYTEPGLKGDTATNTLKPATVESGATVRVPLFINEGETIEIDTRDGSYVGRVKA